jgi:hypothetical protein
MGNLHEDQYKFLIISRSVLLRIRNVLDKLCRKTQNTHFIFSNFFPENHAVDEIMWKNSRAGEATDNNMALGTLGHTHSRNI